MRSRGFRGRALRVDAGGGRLDLDQAEGIEDSRPAISEFLRSWSSSRTRWADRR
jgi:hypothetical protein